MDWKTITLNKLVDNIDYCLDNIKNKNPDNGEFPCPECQGTTRYLSTNKQLDVWCSTQNCINFSINE